MRLRPALLTLCAASALLSSTPAVHAQAAPLPTADAVLAAYHRAVGGAERLAAIRDATYEWNVTMGGTTTGAKSFRKRPGALREEFANGMANVSTPGAVWSRGPGGAVRMSEGAGAATSRLQAVLEASFLTGLAEQGITARVLGRDTADGQPVHRVEFATVDGARRAYLFSAESGLITRVEYNPERGTYIRYGDWRSVDGVLEPHRVEIVSPRGAIGFALGSVRYNTGVADSVFAPPASATVQR